MLNWILTPIIRNHKKQRGNNIVLQTGTIHDYISHDFLMKYSKIPLSSRGNTWLLFVLQ